MKSKNNNNDNDDDDDDDDDNNNNNMAMGSVHARGDTFLTFGLKALTETNTSRLATGPYASACNKKCIHFKLHLEEMKRKQTLSILICNQSLAARHQY
jgi:hypothetical protein